MWNSEELKKKKYDLGVGCHRFINCCKLLERILKPHNRLYKKY